MNIQKTEGLLSAVMAGELPTSPSSQQLFSNQDAQDEEASDCPLLTPSPPNQTPDPMAPLFNPLEGTPLEMTPTQTLDNINSEDGLKAFMNIVNSSSKIMNDEPSSRDPMVESSSSEESSVTNEPVCTQLLTQLNTAYQHLAPDAQAIFYNQENGGKPPLVPIQLMVPKPPKDYSFMRWNWPRIRKVSFWFMVWILGLCTALAIRGIAMMPRRCDPEMEWWQGSLFYEIFPASFQDSSKMGDGMGDLRGITTRLDYLKDLGVKGVRLNSIFRSENYPENYSSVTSLTAIDENLGTQEDFDALVANLHSRNMSLILDLPLYPFIKSLTGGMLLRFRQEETNDTSILSREKREDEEETNLQNQDKDSLTGLLASLQTISISTTSMPSILEFSSTNIPAILEARKEAYISSNHVNPERDENVVTSAIRFWSKKGVDGFYLKGLKNYVNDANFVQLLNDWRIVAGSRRIIICDWEALNSAPQGRARDTLLDVLDLVDVNLRLSNGTKDVKAQIDQVTKGFLFAEPYTGRPWVHWSIGGVDSPRVTSTLKVHNSSAAVTLLGMMLPGTPSIFYGDEIGMTECDCKDHQDLGHLHNLAPMYWEGVAGSTEKFTHAGAIPWLPISSKPIESDMLGSVSEMAKLRQNTVSIFAETAVKHDKVSANCGVRYSEDELIVLERWYPRQNTYVYVANLGSKTQTKDLSSLYYDGHIVVGPPGKINQDIFFKQLTVAPGEAYIIKLDK